MSSIEYIFPRKSEAIAIASDLQEDKIGILDGVRRLVELLHEIGLDEDEDGRVLKGIESEMDDFPSGEARLSWDQEALAAQDLELRAYEESIRPLVRQACHRFILKHGG